MKSTELVEKLFNGPQYKISDIPSVEGTSQSGVYLFRDKGKVDYIGKAEGVKGIVDRVVRQHGTGNSCVSSFCNYIRSEYGIVVTTQEAREFTGLAPVKIEELKVQDYLDKNVRCTIVPVDTKTELEDLAMKPEDFLLRKYCPDNSIPLFNFATKRSEKVTLQEYRSRMGLS